MEDLAPAPAAEPETEPALNSTAITRTSSTGPPATAKGPASAPCSTLRILL